MSEATTPENPIVLPPGPGPVEVIIVRGPGTMRCRAPGRYDVGEVSQHTGLRCVSPSRTVQEQRDEADINTIVRMFGVTGRLPAAVRPPTYGDFSGAGDYQTALGLIEAADAAFMTLPATVRSTFQNDPAAFVAFCDDPANVPQLREWGMALPAPQEPVEPPPAPPATPPAA